MLKKLGAVLCLVTILSVAASMPVLAIPTFRGYTGLLRIPTADALNKGDWNVGLFSEDVEETITSYIGTYGLDNGLEIGINRFQPTEESDRETLLYGKYRFLSETDAHPAVAAGIFDLTDEVDTTLYIVASKSMSTPVGTYHGEIINPRIHVGFGAGQFDSLFAGISTYVGNRIEVMGEYDSRRWDAGARFRITPGLTVHAGFFDIGDGSSFGVGGSFQRSY